MKRAERRCHNCEAVLDGRKVKWCNSICTQEFAYKKYMLAVKERYRECRKCKTTRPLNDFYPTSPQGYHRRICKSCTVSGNKEREVNDPTDKKRRAHLRSLYGITLEEYEAMFQVQKGRCAVCGGTGKDGRRLSVDHDHTTGLIRGLLCGSCNRYVIARARDASIFYAAAQYLEYPPAVDIIGEKIAPDRKKKRPRKRPRGVNNG